MLITQISVFIENQPGKLGEVTQVLADNGVDMSALSQLAGLVLDENRDLGDEHRILLLLFRCG